MTRHFATLIVTLFLAMPVAASGKQPAPVTLSDKAQEMQTMILQATRAGDFNALTEAIQWNELPPAFADKKVDDPIAHFKKQSIDGEGFQMLGILRAVLEAAPALRKAPNGKPDFIWPAAAEKPWSKLTPAEKADAMRILPADQAKTYVKGGAYRYYSVMIGHDGTWHSFERD